MKKHYSLYAVLLVTAALISGCNDVDLQNIDSKADLDMGLVMPVGSMRATIGDFLGNGQVKGIYVGPNDVLFFEDTFKITREFHDVDLKEKTSDVTEDFNVYKELKRQKKLDDDGNLTGDGKQIKLEFPFALKLKNVNGKEDQRDERIDSALIENAMFTSIVGRTSLPLPEEWVDRVEIVLGKEFKRNAGKTITVCSNNFEYDKRIPINVDQFMLNLMKNQHPYYPDEYLFNVYDSCHLQINFYFTPPVGSKKQIPATARYNYKLEVEFIDFTAIWGYFSPSKNMRDKGILDIEEEWPKWRDLNRARLPFSDPKVDMYVNTKIAGQMVMHGKYLYAKSNALNDSVFATFNEAMTKYDYDERFEGQPHLELSSRIGDSIRMKTVFDKQYDKGHIDRLFTIRPDILGYEFYVDFDTQKTPQIRVLPNTDVRVEAVIHAPFLFNQGLEASYKDTISDLDLSEVTIDSLLSGVDMIDSVKASDLKLVLDIQNLIPLQMKGVFRFIDENNKIIMDPKLQSVPLRVAETDTLYIAAPKTTKSQGQTIIDKDKPGRSVFTIALDREHIDVIHKIKSIQFYAELDAQPLDPYVDEDFRIRLTTGDALKVNIALSAYVDAVLNFDNKEKNNK